MNTKLYITIIAIMILFYNCSNDDSSFSTVVPLAISFIHENGDLISENDCVNPNEKYSVMIKVNTLGSGSFIPTEVPYTINGVLYNMTFISGDDQINPIDLVEGENIVQLAESGITSKVSVITQDDFELVE
ncbi:hypothetical protein [uncultured Aquimarina sp.]|uniref:hypothetical protein n=1 Tax=uncultured Aquimarina sp. TaxID=575652 RepID=UPI0026061F6F|nr:hypothetical protein [uncultured Aquimarina sp.]